MSRMIDEEELKDYGLIEINGCDVTECEFYDDLECNAYRQEYWEPQDNTKDLCKCHPNCYFKQLQRLKDKSEKIDYRFKQTKKSNKQYKIDIKNLQDENEKLKRLINMHLTTLDKCCVNGLIMSNNMSEVLNEQNDR